MTATFTLAAIASALRILGVKFIETGETVEAFFANGAVTLAPLADGGIRATESGTGSVRFVPTVTALALSARA